jgi:hypothetical protein
MGHRRVLGERRIRAAEAPRLVRFPARVGTAVCVAVLGAGLADGAAERSIAGETKAHDVDVVEAHQTAQLSASRYAAA